MPVCMTIAGLDPSGGAGVIADIRAFAAFGCFGVAAITSLTFQNTLGVFGAEHQSAECVRRQAQPVIDDLNVDALKTGMLPTIEIIKETARLIKSNNLKNIVVDPVVRSTSGFDLIDDAALTALIDTLFPIADLVTPNIPEAERITGLAINNVEDIFDVAAEIRAMGARNVLIKGGHGTRVSCHGESCVRKRSRPERHYREKLCERSDKDADGTWKGKFTYWIAETVRVRDGRGRLKFRTTKHAIQPTAYKTNSGSTR